MESAIYFGTLRHRRISPRRHKFTYPVFMTFLDVDRIPELMRVSPFASYNCWNWAAFDDRDHFGDPAKPLRQRIEGDAAKLGITLPDGKIFLLTHLRYWGYAFNPVSFFYCYSSRGNLEMILAEVNNTFGDSRNYWLTPANEIPSSNAKRYSTPKLFHVSPFMVLDLENSWIFTPPGERLVAHMNTLENGRPLFDATLQMNERLPWSASALHRALVRHPWMTAKVIAAIHWQALKLFWKRIPFVPHPGRTRAEQSFHLAAHASRARQTEGNLP